MCLYPLINKFLLKDQLSLEMLNKSHLPTLAWADLPWFSPGERPHCLHFVSPLVTSLPGHAGSLGSRQRLRLSRAVWSWPSPIMGFTLL